MKEMSSFEIQLHSWELRRPSATLKHRIFGQPSRQPSSRPDLLLAFRWLAPAAACALLATTVLNHQSGISTAAPRPDPMVAMIRSNQSAAAEFSNNVARTGRTLAASGFGWTNRSDSTSSIGSFLPVR
jgi:hypothetical protein